MRVKIYLLIILSSFIFGCSTTASSPTLTPTAPPINTPAPEETNTPAPEATRTPIPVITSTDCKPSPVIVPTLPSKIPGYTELDSSTGLHMTGQYQVIDATTYRLKVAGKVEHELSLSYDDLRCLPKVQVKANLTCPGYFEDFATWGGVPFSTLLKLAGLQSDAKRIIMYGADDYSSSVSVKDALSSDNNILAYEWHEETLPILHGFPLRAVFPGFYGSYWVKWLTEITVE